MRGQVLPSPTVTTCLLILALLLPGPVLAQGGSSMQKALRTVNRLYEELEYERALAQIASARTLATTTDEDVTLSLYQGVILGDMSRWEESAAAFKTALFLRPEAKLPVKVSPKVEQHFEKVRQQVQQELAANAKPPVATVEPKPAAPPLAPSAPPEPSPEVSGRSFTRPQVLIPAIGGAVLLVAGGTSYALSRGELSRLNGDDPKLTTREEVRSAASKGRTLQAVGVGLLGAGVVGLGFAAGWHVFGPPSNEMALRVGTDGTSAFVQGRWP